MLSWTVHLTFIVLLLCLQTCLIFGQSIMKNSLTFVIDDTYSMYNEIDQVKRSVNSIFDTVESSKDSPIDNFILVTFNDPDAHLLTITKDRDVFKSALASITVHGGGDCPEYAMKGIKIALENSLPRSVVYVFTDASTYESNTYEELKSLALKKQIQVTYLLTGECGVGDGNQEVYYNLAETTNGEVFNIMKTDITDVLTYVKDNIKSRADVPIAMKLSPGFHNVTFAVDGTTKDATVSVSGVKPKIKVTDPEGKTPKTEKILDKEKVTVVKIPDPIPGNYTAEVGSSTSGSFVKVAVKTTVNFQHGFSSFKPTSLSDTATRPAPDGNAYLSILLDGIGVKLQTVKILDMSDNIIQELPLRLVDEVTNFYATDSFDPPRTTFRISIHGYDEKTKSPIKRVSTTPIERQKLEHERPVNTAPKVTIEGGLKITKDYHKPLQLKCKVRGYPKPDIIWQEKETGITLPATVTTIDVPYDYMSILNIEKISKNHIYECKATNLLGVNINYVEVDLKVFFIVEEIPEDIKSIKYNQEGTLVCKVNASPPATISWYKDGALFSGNRNVVISSDMTTLTIKHMFIETQGMYKCEARNDIETKVFHSKVEVSGLAKPKLDKTLEEIHVLKGSNGELACGITEGVPPPTIEWQFQRQHNESFQTLKETSEVLHLKNATLGDAGSYLCIASNVLGSERHALDLLVNYPPSIKDDKVKIIRAKDESIVTLPCDADGVPDPTVKWYKNGTRLEDTENIYITTSLGLKFRAITVSDSGYYTCEAENEHGIAKKSVLVDVFVPVNIETPKESIIEAMVGQNVLLPCRADGYPAPSIKWIYNNFDEKSPPKHIRSHKKAIVLHLNKIQLRSQGYYTCVASNTGGSSNITYEVKVYAPPIIENSYQDKTFTAVQGDLALRIQCKASGSPKPTIIWKKDDLNIAFGSEWYDIENGTLIIKNIDEKSQGTYLCLAKNKIGNDTMVYKVNVKDHPSSSSYIPTKFIEDGESVDIACDISHQDTDLLRWYKDSVQISEGELRLERISSSDAGLYSCRVSDHFKSRSAHVNINVGYKPFFVSDESELIDFVENDYVRLSCEAEGYPEPEVSWKLNDKKISETEMMYDLQMRADNRGTYTCEVSNELGSIQRSFKIVSKACILNTKQDFLIENQPVMLSPSLGWPTFRVIDSYMIIDHTEPFLLHCPKGFSILPSKTILEAFCKGESDIQINGNIFKYSDIKCNEAVKPVTRRLGEKCLRGNTEYVHVGHLVLHKFLKVYDVCLDKDNNVPLFTQHEVSSAQYDALKNSTTWFENELLPLNFDTIYDCKTQVDEKAINIYHLNDRCCFNKRQLVSPKDLQPGVPSEIAYTYLNVVPHWSTCNSKNWADVEQRVRSLAKLLGNDLIVSTGTTNLRRKSSYSYLKRSDTDIVIHDERGTTQPIAKYLWKIVQDPASSSSIAIIQVNVPDLSAADAPSYVHCKDICNDIEWLRSTNWRNVADGYTYCCSILEFEAAFNYRGQFSRDQTAILNYRPLTPEYYYSLTLV